MTDTFWIVVTRDGASRLVKGRRAKYQTPERPALKQGEYAVLVTIRVSDAVFRPAPLPEATITVPETAIVAPQVRVDVESPPPLPDGEAPT